MNDPTATPAGRQALGRVLEQLVDGTWRIKDGEDAEAIANAIWPQFRSAVAAAVWELREMEARGVQQWQRARHG